MDLTFNSSSDNFGELLRLVPAEYEEQVAGLETQGSLSISGGVSGTVGGKTLPSFLMDISGIRWLPEKSRSAKAGTKYPA
ncbi:MAG: hypothetical protein U5K69_26580 [Balneolaceae bacterium]|nr:hypothetical protein [Balneolaceae bacterium]